MPEARDHVINNRTRSVLLRRWIDLRGLSFGSVNGVIYLRGALKRNPLFPTAAGVEGPDDELKLLHLLDRDLRAIEGVKDLVLEIDGFELRGEHWERTTTPTTKSTP